MTEPRVTSAQAAGIMALLRAEIAAAVRMAALLGVIGALGPFALVLLQVQVYRMVIPTGSMPTAAGLVAGFAIAAALVIALSHLRELALLALGNRLARRLAAPAVLAAAERGGEPATAATQALEDVDEVRRGVTGALCASVLDALLVPVLLLLLALFHWMFAVIGVVCCMVVFLLSLATERMTREALTRSNATAAHTAGLVADAMRCAEAVEAMRSLAADTGTCVAFGGMRAAEGGGRHNAYHLADGPSGRLWTQDKLLPAIGEHAVPGTGSVVADVDGLRVGVAICWEAWFPEVPRARALAGADLLLFPTGAIVQEVHDVWLSVVAARAAENTCFAACSVNLLGVERGMAAVHGPEGPLGARDDEGLLLAAVS